MECYEARKVLASLLPSEQIWEQEPMSRHTSLHIGGPASFLVQPSSVEQLQKLVQAIQGFPFFVMGNGSNLLVSDEGYRGIVIKLGNLFGQVTVQGNTVTAQSGAFLSRIANVACANGLSGFEFAAGIPGTLGGALMMNAGAYGGEMKDVVVSTCYLDETGQLKEFVGQQHQFDYRRSAFTGTGLIVVSSTMQLSPGRQEDIRHIMADFAQRRRSKQPLEWPSAGSVFKRPKGHYAGELIERAGLRGHSVGGAQVSEKHCGFIINKGGATCADFLALVDDIKQTVYKQFGVELELEVKRLGE